MSTPSPADQSSPNNPTRQQLEELDALLQRMLALPVKRDEENAPPAAAAEEPVALPSPELVSASPPLIPSAGVFFRIDPSADFPVSDEAAMPSPAAGGEAFLAREAEAAQPLPAPPSAAGEKQTGPLPMPRRLPSPPPSHALSPLVWCNRAFDRLTVPLGSTGHWLRRPAGRNLLGVAGLLCLAAALGLVVLDWVGWPR